MQGNDLQKKKGGREVIFTEGLLWARHRYKHCGLYFWEIMLSEKIEVEKHNIFHLDFCIPQCRSCQRRLQHRHAVTFVLCTVCTTVPCASRSLIVQCPETRCAATSYSFLPQPMFSDALTLPPLSPLRAYISLYALLTSVKMVSWAQLIGSKATIYPYTHLPLPRGAGAHRQLGPLVIYHHDFPSLPKTGMWTNAPVQPLIQNKTKKPKSHSQHSSKATWTRRARNTPQ